MYIYIYTNSVYVYTHITYMYSLDNESFNGQSYPGFLGCSIIPAEFVRVWAQAAQQWAKHPEAEVVF